MSLIVQCRCKKCYNEKSHYGYQGGVNETVTIEVICEDCFDLEIKKLKQEIEMLRMLVHTNIEHSQILAKKIEDMRLLSTRYKQEINENQIL